MTTYLTRNALAVSPLAAGIGAVDRIRPLGREGLSAALAYPVLPSFQPPLLQVLLIAAISAQVVIAVFLGFNQCVEIPSTALTDDFPYNGIWSYTSDFFFIPLSQRFLIFVFPIAVPHGIIPFFHRTGGPKISDPPHHRVYTISASCSSAHFCRYRILLCAFLWQASQQYFTSLLVVVNAFPQFPQTHSWLLPAAASCR